MSNKYSLIFVLSLIALSVSGVQAQTDWGFSSKKPAKQIKKPITVRTSGRQNEIIIATPDQVIVRPAIRSNVRSLAVRPVAPRPPAVRSNVEVYRDKYSSDRNNYFGNYERNYENRYGSVAEVARLNGYRDGLREGAKDARDGDEYNPFSEHAYKDGATGYISKYKNKDSYKQTYRQSFVRGYKESFDRYLGNYDRRNW